MSVGAQPSQTVGRLLGQAGVIPKPPPPISLKTQLRGPKNPDKGNKR
jgi:small subunit ribosomal protein S16